jgi:DNA-binding MarR family transcriptional regulator
MQQTTEHAQLAKQCLSALTDLAAQARPTASAWSELNLSMGQLKAVGVLACGGPRSISELGRLLGMSEPGASVLVDSLEQAGLAARQSDARDRRRTLVVPTQSAVALSERLRQVKHERMAAWLERVSDDDLRALLRGARALAAAIRGVSDDAPPEAPAL